MTYHREAKKKLVKTRTSKSEIWSSESIVNIWELLKSPSTTILSVLELLQSDNSQTKRFKSSHNIQWSDWKNTCTMWWNRGLNLIIFLICLPKVNSSNSEDGDFDIAIRFPIYFELSEIFVSEKEVINNLRNVDGNKSHGPDEIYPRLLKTCHEQIGPSLCALLNHPLNCGRLPTEWKSAKVTHVHKKGFQELAENYQT